MASTKQSALSRSSQKAYTSNQNIVLGHLGRISYLPRSTNRDHDHDGPGYVLISRTIENVPSFQQVTAFEQILASSPGRTLLEPPTSFRAQRSQQHYLLKAHPEAFLGLAADLKPLLREDAAMRRAQSRKEPACASLLPVVSIGEIADPTSHRNDCPALAVVCGENGDVVRVVRLYEEQRHWGGEGGSSIPLKTPDPSYEGFWSTQGAPVLKLQFCSSPQHPAGRRRWLLVQTTVETLVFQPRILEVPVLKRSDCYIGDEISSPSYVALDPMLNIKAAGAQNADFSLDPGGRDSLPRLAVIDTYGNWSVWDIQHQNKRKIGDMKATTTLQYSGHVPQAMGREGLYRVFWVTPRESRGRALAVCTTKTLTILGINDGDGAEYPQTTLSSIVDPKRPESILDVATCPGDDSIVVLLTGNTIFWLRLARTYEGKEPFKVTILLSCLHLRSPMDMTLRLTVARPDQEERCLVFIYSSNGSSRTTLYWFSSQHSVAENTAFHRQTAHLALPEGVKHLRSVVFAPVEPNLRSKNPPFSPTTTLFAQCFVLDKTLGLHSALHAVQTTPNLHRQAPEIPAPIALRKALGRYRSTEVNRRRALSHLRGAFVVRDEYTPLLEQGWRYRVQQEAAQVAKEFGKQEDPWEQAEKETRLDLEPAMRTVLDRILAKIGSIGISPRDDAGPPDPFAAVRRVVEDGLMQGHLPAMTLLEAAGQATGDLSTDVRGSRWTERLAQLRETAVANAHLQVMDLSGAILATADDISAMYKHFLDLWASTLPEGLLNAQQTQYREVLIASIAMEVFLAQTAISVAPPWSWPRAASEAQSQQGRGQFSSQAEVGLPSLSATPSSSRAPSEARSTGPHQLAGDLDADAAQDQDPAAVRLARYASSICQVPASPEPSALLAQWPEAPGSDPGEFAWSWTAGVERRNAARQAAEKRAREARRARLAEKRAAMGLGSHGAVSQHQQAPRPGLVVVAPRLATSSQGAGSATQMLSSQPLPPQSLGGRAMSQPLAGRHGDRGLAKNNKKNAAKARRMGFR